MELIAIQRKIQSLKEGLIPWKSELKRFNHQSRIFTKHIKEVQAEIDELAKLLED